MGLTDLKFKFKKFSLRQFKFQTCVFQKNNREAIKDRNQGVEEIVLAEKIIAHLIRKDQVLLVVDQPTRNEGEAAADFNKRVQNERVLALNPNYAME